MQLIWEGRGKDVVVACRRQVQEHDARLGAFSLDQGFWNQPYCLSRTLYQTWTLAAVPKKERLTVDEQERKKPPIVLLHMIEHGDRISINNRRASRYAAVFSRMVGMSIIAVYF